jgi:hypothetical protein
MQQFFEPLKMATYLDVTGVSDDAAMVSSCKQLREFNSVLHIPGLVDASASARLPFRERQVARSADGPAHNCVSLRLTRHLTSPTLCLIASN